jgi:SAM-dependent methyltransferase/GT2 family glycosyltransferase
VREVIIFGTCFAGDGSRYREIAEPSVRSIAAAGDEVLAAQGDARGICDVYNDFIDIARSRADCEALVLLQDDVEVIDPDFRTKALEAVRRPKAGVVGAIGARSVRGLAWWQGEGVGRVYETRGPIWFKEASGSVEALDGLLLVLSPAAFRALRFDAANFPGFHGYDVDVCLQARSIGLAALVVPLGVVHRTRGGLGDEEAFFAADRALYEKWKTTFAGLSPLEVHPAGRSRRALRATLRTFQRAKVRIQTKMKRLRVGIRQPFTGLRSCDWQRLTPSRARTAERDTLRCVACLAPVTRTGAGWRAAILRCTGCGSGTSWPPPTVDPSSDRIWREQYSGQRSRRRHVWIAEAHVRLDWLETILPASVEQTRILEIGSGTGEFVEVALARGLRVEGVEPSVAAVVESRRHGVELFCGTLDAWVQSASSGKPIDFVVMWHVLEHLPRPLDTLVEIRQLMGAGARLVLEVPNFGSSESARLGLDWHHAQPAEHFHHFTADGLERLIRRSGFSIVEVQELTEECYFSEKAWAKRRNQALLDRYSWPPLDLLRAIAS